MRARRMWALTTTAALAITLGAAVVTAGPAAAVAPTVAPTLTAPEPDATVSANPVFSWAAVSGAAKYRVQISTSGSFATLTYNQETVGLQVTPSADLPSGDLYWRVAALDSASAAGPFSEIAHLTKSQAAGPTLASPANGAVLQFPSNPAVFTWDPIATADYYTLQVDDASDFIGATSYTTTNTSYTLTTTLTVGQPFYWRVQATSTNGSASLWSETRSFSYSWFTSPLVRPTLLSPANTTSTSITDVVFEWQSVPGATAYQLQVSPNGDWANNSTIDEHVVKGTRYSPATTINNGSYFWRVRAADATTATPNYGPWSAEWQFKRAWPERPTLTAPAWDPADPTTIPRVSGSLVLSWTPVPHAASYEIQVSTDINFSTSTNCFTNRTQWTPYVRKPSEPNCLLNSLSWATGQTYYWHVRGIDDFPSGVNGLWSNTDTTDTFRFIRDPSMPAYVSPADGAIVSAPSLKWQAVQGAATYKVTIKKASGSTLLGYPVTTYATSYTPTSALTSTDGPFSWYVQAVDAEGVTSVIPAESSWRTFSLVLPTTSMPLTLTAPADATSSVGMPQLTWTDYPGATKYEVYYGANGYISGTLGTNLPYASFTKKEAPLTAGTYFWGVKAFDALGQIAASDERTFTISAPDVLGSSDYLTPEKCTPSSPCTAVTDTPTLSWNAVANTAVYEVTIAYDADFTNVYKVYDTAYTTLTPRESFVDNQAGQAFYWFVRPCVVGDATHCGPGPENGTANDNASAFQKRSNAIELTSPADGATVADGEITFSWNDFLDTNGSATVPATQEAEKYHLEVSTSADFSDVIDEATVDQTTYTAHTKTYPEGPLYWHVQAVDCTGNLLTFSDANSTTWTLTKSSPVPELSSPADHETVSGVPLLEWAPVAFGAKYEVEVYKNGDTSFSVANRVVSRQSKFSAYSPTAGLASGDYVWRVRRLDADNLQGSWSDARLFTLQAAAPTLTAPDDAAVLNSNSVLFAWTAVVHAAKYTWEVSTSSSFSSPTSQTTVMTAWSPLLALTDGTRYWRVKALDGDSNVISISATRSYVKDVGRPTVTAKSPTSTLAVGGPFTATFSEPVHGVSASTFTVVVAGTTTSVAGTVTPSAGTSTTTATFTPTAALTPGQSYTASLTSGITDLVGNPLVAVSWTVRASTTVQNDSLAFRDVWDRDLSASASGGGYSAAQTYGFTATFTFTGTTVALVGLRHKNGGYAAIDLDGVRKVSALSFYSSITQWRKVLYTATGLADTTHTLRVVVLGTKPSASTGRWVDLDAFTVGAVTYQETDASVRYQFRRVSTSSASGGSYDLGTHATGSETGSRPSFNVQFKGTRVYVYGTKSTSSGKAAIYIDRALRATVSLYGRTQYRAMLYSSPALSSAVHSIRIDIVGTSAGTTSSVGIDYVQVS